MIKAIKNFFTNTFVLASSVISILAGIIWVVTVSNIGLLIIQIIFFGLVGTLFFLMLCCLIEEIKSDIKKGKNSNEPQ